MFILNPYIFVAPLDSDAQAFITAVSITDSTQKSAINQLVIDLKSANIWTKMKAIYPFVGGTATSHKFNLKDPRDLDVAYRLVFNGGWTHSSTGALPNGTTAYADTKLAPSAVLTNFSLHLSHYSRTQDSANTSHDIGSETATSANNLDLFQYFAGSVLKKGFIDGAYPSNAVQVNNTNTLGFQIGSRTSNVLQSLFFNGSLIGTNTTTKTLGYPSTNMVLAATNTIGTISAYSSKEIAFSSIGDGLTDADAAAFYNAVQAYQIALGRQV